VKLERENERLRVAIEYAIDEICYGDAWAAVDTLNAALEGGPGSDPYGTRRRCPVCGLGPLLPGEVATHCDRVHPFEELPRAA
jgi:hypothetical protein